MNFENKDPRLKAFVEIEASKQKKEAPVQVVGGLSDHKVKVFAAFNKKPRPIYRKIKQ